MIQLQFISYVLSSKNYSIVSDNNITSDYFLEYEDEFNFIKDHYENYKNVPDVETFLNHFSDEEGKPTIELVEVTESERYLVETLREEYLYSKSVPVIKHAAELLKTDANAASQYLQSEIVNLSPNYTTPAVDIIHSDSRLKLFEDKTSNPNAWYIQTGFPELDEILYGWQKGEEYVVIVARTGQGKSWVLVRSMYSAWLQGNNVGYISPEMTADKIGYRFDTLNNHFSNRALNRGKTDEISVDDYAEYFNNLASHPNKFLVSTPLDFNKKITVSKLRTYIMQNKLDVLAIDGITYLSDDRYKRGDNKTITLTNISEDLMQLSVEMRIPIIVVVQSNRGGVKEDANETPALEDIRDSDGISHNATKVISLRQKDDALIMEIKKHRDGSFGDKICYSWDIDTGEFLYNPGLSDSSGMPVKRRERKVSENKVEEKRVAF